jgi:4'-phosphopantetheinyl transferase
MGDPPPATARLALPSGEVHLWCTSLERLHDQALLTRYAALLSSDERARRDAFRFDEHRHEYLVTRALVRTVLSRYAATLPGDWRFRWNEYGRPDLDGGGPGLRFNLSNTAGLVVCLVAAGSEVGVDVERRDRAPAILELAPSVFSSCELAELRALRGAAQQDRALALWTLKEAYIKARGMGLAIDLAAFSFRFESDRIRVALDPSLHDDPGRWEFRLVDRGEYRIALALERTGAAAPRVRVWETTPLADASESPGERFAADAPVPR